MTAVLDRPARSDSLPEERVYRDDGCAVAPRCLACPLPACRYDVPLGVQRAAALREHVRELHAAGASIDGMAELAGCSRRNVFRILRQLRVAG